MIKYGLIGYPLKHSFSQRFFTEKFERENIDAIYLNFEIPEITQLPEIIESNPELQGLNVTIPYKESVITFLDELDDTAREIGAVNTIRISNGKLKGFNTDTYGFMQSIMPLLEPMHSRALILGTGGSSKAVAWSLKKMGIDYLFVSRKPENSNEIGYSELDNEVIRQSKIIINTTPRGMFPQIDDAPEIPYESITASHLLFDLIYNPEETLFLKKGRAQQAKTRNGLEMLQLQAERSWQIWNT